MATNNPAPTTPSPDDLIRNHGQRGFMSPDELILHVEGAHRLIAELLDVIEHSEYYLSHATRCDAMRARTLDEIAADAQLACDCGFKELENRVASYTAETWRRVAAELRKP